MALQEPPSFQSKLVTIKAFSLVNGATIREVLMLSSVRQPLWNHIIAMAPSLGDPATTIFWPLLCDSPYLNILI